nr:hypothetical protein [Saccharicrinis aurantiacus]
MEKYENKKAIRFSLKTKNKFEAMKKAVAIEEELLQVWAQFKKAHGNMLEFHSKATAIARNHGFSYKSCEELSISSPITELTKRLDIAFKHLGKPEVSKALLGVAKTSSISLKKSIDLFWTQCSDRFANKSEH